MEERSHLTTSYQPIRTELVVGQLMLNRRLPTLCELLSDSTTAERNH